MGRRLEKGVAKVGSMKVQLSRTEKGFEVSMVGAGILPIISNIMSWGRVSSLEFWVLLQVEGRGWGFMILERLGLCQTKERLGPFL